jgi:hypothetical protein
MELQEKIKLTMKSINAYIGNIKLVEKNIQFNQEVLNELYNKTALEYKPYVKDVISWDSISELVINPCIDICYFNDQHLKVMRFIKWHLSKYSFSDYVRDIMIEVLEDTNRIKPIINDSINAEKNIKNIISEIKKLDLTKPFQFEMVEGITLLEYLNDGKNCYDDAKKFTNIWFSINGYITPESERHENYLNENFSPELIEAIEKSKIASIINKQPVNNSTKNNLEIEPIKWQGSNVQLTYLFKELQEANLIPNNVNLWALLERHFVDSKNKPMKNLAQSYDGMINSKTGTNKHTDITNIIEKTKKFS